VPKISCPPLLSTICLGTGERQGAQEAYFRKLANVSTGTQTAFTMAVFALTARRSSAARGPQPRQLAKRRLSDFRDEQRRTDRSQGKLTLAELCDRYLQTVQNQKRKTVERKNLIVRRIKEHWSTGRLTQVAKVKPSDVDLWLSRYTFGPVSRNLHIACAKEVFAMAVRDNVIARSPAVHPRGVKLSRPIRVTPSFQQFRSIIADVRARSSTRTRRTAPIFWSSLAWLDSDKLRLVHSHPLILIFSRTDSSPFDRKQRPDSRCRSSRRCVHFWNVFAKARRTTKGFLKSETQRRR